MVCILLNPILLIPPDSALAIRHNVFFIGVLFNNTLIDGDRSIRIGPAGISNAGNLKAMVHR